MIVMKFGGTSVESRAAIERIACIVLERLERRPVVVVSAMGKTTNELLHIAAEAVKGEHHVLAFLGRLRDFHLRESEGLGIEYEINKHFKEIKALVRGLKVMREITPRVTDTIAAFGERLSSIIVRAVFREAGIPVVHVDARCFIKTDSRHTHATPLIPQTNALLRQYLLPPLERGIVPVMGGFIGSTENNVTTTLGRGGSDYTAAIVGAGIGADEIQIWTDVDGMLTVDPRILPGGRAVEACSFAEAAELAYFGAKVLHPATVLPAMEKDIPVRILNSRSPEIPGTLITASAPISTQPIRSIACKRNITLVNIVSTRMLMAHGFLRRIFEIFDRFETPVDMLATSEVSVSLTIDDTRALEAIAQELAEFSEVCIYEDQAIVCLVGEDIRRSPSTGARIFNALKGVDLRMISQGASLLNVSLVVGGADVTRAVESLHREFFGDPMVSG